MVDLAAVLASWGDDRDAAHRSEVMSEDAWFAAAHGRPAWELWGKGRPSGSCPAHPVLLHMLDVAAVAALLLTRIAPRALRQRLLSLHPDGELASLRLLLFVIALHDLGKITPAFQAKLPWAQPLLRARGFDLDAPESARHHGDAGLGFLRDALRELGLPNTAARALARAVTAHHGEFPTDASLNGAFGGKERGRSERWNTARHDAVAMLREFFDAHAPSVLAVDHPFVMQLAGITAVADWIGSMEEVFAYEPPQPSLAAYWPLALQRAALALDRVGMRASEDTTAQTFEALFPTYTPWPLHRAAEALASTLDGSTLVIVEAPMGEGKTEASLLLANAAAARLGQQGLYIGLPTKATANQMLGRVRSFLERTRPDAKTNLMLAHPDAELVEGFRSLVAIYDRDARTASGVRAEGWFLSKKRTLLADHAVGTIDQALLGVMRTQHAFVRLYGLAGKTVILDEVHAYDTYTSTILERLVEWLASLGTTVLLLSATLPRARREALANAYRRGLGASTPSSAEDIRYPRVTTATRDRIAATHVTPRGEPVSVSVKRVDDDLDAIARELAAEVRDGGCVGWICNTVDRAQAAYEALRKIAPEIPRLLIHARMLPEDRAARERQLEALLGPTSRGAQRPERCIVVGTQVLEQSLDVDFDLLVTDLAPIDLLLQRAGRLHRHRERTNRAPAHPSPRLWVVHPAGPYDSVPIRDVAIVYPEALVRGTLRELEGRRVVTLPDDIETLVEAVYSADLSNADDALRDAYIDHLGRAVAQRQDAENRLIKRPTYDGDIFGDLKVSFREDEDPKLHADLRALTRDADDSVQVVCLVARDGALYVTEADTTPINLDAIPDRALAARLARRTIGISRPALVRELTANASYLPSAWNESALLRHRRMVAFADRVAVVGDTRIELDPELGLKIEKPRTRSGN